MSLKPVFVVAGLGAGGGTGASSARAFVKEGYSVALIGRRASELKALEDDLKASGAEVRVASFAIPSYGHADVASAFAQIHSRYPSNTHSLRAALYNAGNGVWKPFLDVTPEDVQLVTQSNIEGSFAFSHHVLKAFKNNSIDPVTGKRGVLIFTGATASIRGNVTTSAFAAGKFALRALSQSLAKEFGKENIHVAHAIIDGGILTPLSKGRRNDPQWEQNEDVRLNPDSIAASYVYLAKQDRSSWTWELDLRPAHEKW
ncbi:NAD(P)-binding protein [Dendrothele bispora CBS 962.96]|uniref:NAD(P)-binding protein n=1 Tax=Dendrothele bispora (strain CBS 962.96) TaxID=1314807 RepID=A0A4S8MRK8_DENBC|nr:NAD(P)-binding protein [Dendrothele bispora CBS 962.96]